MRNITVFHADHGITEQQMKHVQSTVCEKQGFFIMQVDLPAHLGSVPNALYGPVCGDAPITDDMVVLEKRSADRPADRMINASTRPCTYVQVIGIASDSDIKLFTVYGGPLAPRNPADPSLQGKELEESKAFWAVHALAKG